MANSLLSQATNFNPLTTYVEIGQGSTRAKSELSLAQINSAFSVTFAELQTLITNSQLTVGGYYLITDFASVYDLPDYMINGDAKTSVATITCDTVPLLVMASSANTIDENAHQPAHPNDSIKYDASFTETQLMAAPARGRITERIDEYENRTDYDHRYIEFIRYQPYTQGAQWSGAITDFDGATGEVVGDGSALFETELAVGDIIILDSTGVLGYDLGLKVVSITDEANMVVAVEDSYSSLTFTGESFDFFAATAGGVYTSYKTYYIGQYAASDYDSRICFNWADEISDDGYVSSVSNTFGNYAVYEDISNLTFIVPNNRFNSYFMNNKIGDLCNTNDTGTNFQNNVITGTRFSLNVIDNNFTNNIIQDRFLGNICPINFQRNIISPIVSNTDFTAATYVVGDYTKNIIQSDEPDLYVQYFDGAALIYDAITA